MRDVVTADSSPTSEAKMTAQIKDTVSNKLDKCAEIAEMSSSKLVDGPLQPAPIPYYERVKTQSQIAKDGFPKFKELPAELRSKVWEYAMPPYGVFTVLMRGREEPMPQQPPPPTPMAFRKVYRLEPIPHDHEDEELRSRLDTMRAIQSTSSEAASEVQRAFPTTIDCTGGKLRFNADHDTLACSLYDWQCISALGLRERFTRYDEGAIIFANDWHKIPRKMAFNSHQLWGPFFGLFHRLSLTDTFHQYLEGFMKFLADCTRLGSFGFIFPRPWRGGDLDVGSIDENGLDRALRFCCPAPTMQGSFYANNRSRCWINKFSGFIEGIQGMEELVHGPHPGHKLPNHWHGPRLGRPALQHLNFKAMVPVDPALCDRMERARQ